MAQLLNSEHREALLGVVLMLIVVGAPTFLACFMSGASALSSMGIAALAIAALLAPASLVQLVRIRPLANGRVLGAASGLSYIVAASSGGRWPVVDLVLAISIVVLSTKPDPFSRIPERGTFSWAGARGYGIPPPPGSDIDYPLRETVALASSTPFVLRGAFEAIGWYSAGALTFPVGATIAASVLAWLTCIAIVLPLFIRDGAAQQADEADVE